VVDLAASSQQEEQTLLPLYAAFYESQAQSSNGPDHLSEQNQTKKREGKIDMSENEPTYEQLQTENTALKQKIAELEAENAALKEKIIELEQSIAKLKQENSEENEAKAALAQVQKELKQFKEAAHQQRVDAVLKARLQAGIVADDKQAEEKQFLAKCSDETLALLEQDALKVAQKVASLESPGPKTRYGQPTREEANQLAAALEAERVRLGFAPRKLTK
jgi:predicted RNase H-like nuclease (RuvC/YqgF family)